MKFPFPLSSNLLGFGKGGHVFRLRRSDWVEEAVAFALCQVTLKRSTHLTSARAPGSALIRSRAVRLEIRLGDWIKARPT